MPQFVRKPLARLGIALAAVVVIAAIIKTGGGPPELVVVSRSPERVMGTSCMLSAVVPAPVWLWGVRPVRYGTRLSRLTSGTHRT